jgi:L-alanine-DL-glutamate epimerase-like enolase superfamily enzyme
VKITNIEVRGYRAPAPKADRSYEACILRIETDSGTAGIAEVPSSPALLRALVDPVPASPVWPTLKAALMGADPLADAKATWERLAWHMHFHGLRGTMLHALSGVDIALWDLRGKALGKSVADILGTRRRERVRAYATVVDLGRTADDVKRRIDATLAHNVRAMKLCAETGWGTDPDWVARVLTTARAHLGRDFPLMVDAYACWPTADAVLPLMPLFREVRLEWLEAPLHPDDLAGFARLAGQGAPIAAGDMGHTTRHEFRTLIEAARPDIVQPDVGWVGGITEMGEIAAVARAAGVRLVPHGYRSNLLLATNLALLAAADSEEWLEFSVSDSPLRWGVTKGRLPVGPDGRVAVPQGPGLGVTLDEDAIAPYRYL